MSYEYRCRKSVGHNIASALGGWETQYRGGGGGGKDRNGSSYYNNREHMRIVAGRKELVLICYPFFNHQSVHLCNVPPTY